MSSESFTLPAPNHDRVPVPAAAPCSVDASTAIMPPCGMGTLVRSPFPVETSRDDAPACAQEESRGVLRVETLRGAIAANDALRVQRHAVHGESEVLANGTHAN